MPSLESVQRRIGAAIFGEADPELLSVIDAGGIAPAARLRIYRNHAFLTLIEALKATYPVVCRLVDERFFSYAAHEYVRETPPSTPCLVEYGESFAEFLRAFPACRGLPYLADVARLEWAINDALHAEEAPALSVDALRAVAPIDAPGLRLTLHPSHRLLVSPWPVNRIWSANQPDAAPDAEVDLDAGAVRLAIVRRGDRAVVGELAPASHA
ncbi:MAG TPA: DNA-binding domain-containing protein, partial [Stellaceae bacterium]|nr:DNA-binding domain-containing protein [Stellaceae bacterium]